MFLLFAIAGCGAWCAHQHWMRLDKENSFWQQSFWPWAIRGFAFPVLIWSAVNFGWGDRFPPLVPNLADAQVSRQPWFGLWVGVCFSGLILVLTHWVAVSYVWILGTMASQAPNKAEFAFNVGVFGLFSGACGGALLYLNGPLYAGAAAIVTILPVVYFTLDLAEEPPPRPVYDRAIGQINFGKYQAAEWELISQLEKRDDDFQGWLMLAELYARQHKNIEDAARVVLEICQHPNTEPVEISVACHKLADWQMEIGENPEGARAALELLCRKLPGTHFARMAQQRIKQLPRSAADFEESKKPKRIQLPTLREEINEPEEKRGNKAQASMEANRLVERLTEDPNDMPTREKLASILAVDLGKVDLGIEQLRLLMGIPDTVEEQKAKWLAQIAAWELKLKHNEGGYRVHLKEIIHKFPQTAQAFAAQRRLFLLDQDRPLPAEPAPG
jgi:hypothetical protein